MKARINEREVQYSIEGDTHAPDDRVLLAHSIDLSAGTTWAAEGYVVAPFLAPEQQEQLRAGLEELVREAVQATGLEVPSHMPMTLYHQLIGHDQARHLEVVRQLKEIQQTKLPVPASVLEARVSELCGRPVQAHNPFEELEVFHMRLVRPGRSDNNPLHRDVWLPDYDDCINIYVPVCGSTPQSSLSLVPGSHWWPESRTSRTQGGAVYNGATYTVPAVTSAPTELHLIRPNPGLQEVLLFSPYLLHGGAVNLNEDETRVSLEMRFWQK
ncbi:phytanoyl-CoA dioxygenase family protein [Hymenobacter tenuis]